MESGVAKVDETRCRYQAALLTLASLNFEALVEFYGQLLQQEPVTFIPAVYAEFQIGGLRLGIFRPKGDQVGGGRQKVADGHAAIGMSLCLEVENLEAAIEHLTRLGYSPPGEILIASHGREVYAYDPDGNWLILHEGMMEE